VTWGADVEDDGDGAAAEEPSVSTAPAAAGSAAPSASASVSSTPAAAPASPVAASPAVPTAPAIPAEERPPAAAAAAAPTTTATVSNLTSRKAPVTKGKLGAKKTLGAAVATVSFEEAERLAKAEEEARERAKLTGMPAPTAAGADAGGAGAATLSSRLAYQDERPAAAMSQEKAANLERLGMGMARLGFGSDGSNTARCVCVRELGGRHA